jgi:hypothetical protein
MRLAVFISFVLFVPLSAFSQKVKVADGRVTVDGKLCYYYTEYNHHNENDNNDITAVKRLDAAAHSGAFSDVNIYAADSTLVATITAQVAASNKNSYLQYIYHVELLPLARSFNVKRESYLPEYLMRDLVKYKVISDSGFNYEGGMALYNSWRNKIGYIPNKDLASASISGYNSEANDNDSFTDTLLQLRGNNIYRHDTLIGSIKRSAYNRQYAHMIMDDASQYYLLCNPSGKTLASLLIISTRSESFLWIGEAKQALRLISADKKTGKMLLVATRVLMANNLL